LSGSRRQVRWIVRSVGVALIVKTTTNPFFVSMEDSAKAAAAKDGVKLTLAAGKKDGDAATRSKRSKIRSLEEIREFSSPHGLDREQRDRKGTQSWPLRHRTRHAPDPANTVDITFATNNFDAGVAIGKWTAAQLGGRQPSSASSTCSATRSHPSTTTATRAS
jgi:fructose transport system substrate-binding protein